MANYFIDKSKFNVDQLAAYEALVAIGKSEVPPADHQEDTPPANPVAKASPEMAPELKDAMEQLADLKKSYEMDKMVEVAKKYAPLGKKENELAKTLYDMKKSNPANYDAYIAILDESLGIVEKSGIFAEIGKSGNAGGSYNGLSGAEAKADAKAREIMKSDPTVGYDEAIAKAWIENPDLVAEYDAEYGN